MLPPTTERVSGHTAEAVNRQIQRDLEDRIQYLATHRSEIPARLWELDREWDIERTLEANASTLALPALPSLPR